ncbi:MAG: hypothetical protein JNL74_03540, partial [Fibrobacteres bacterium]|nr:hypothetical protein [Fibrobacterota bacterium]
NGLALMQIAAETDHWSDYAAFKRSPRTFYVDSAAKLSGGGKSWKDPFKTIDQALAMALSGDTIKITAGTYSISQPLQRNPVISGGWYNLGKLNDPAKFQTIISTRIIASSDASFIGIIAGAGIKSTGNILKMDRCAIKNIISLENCILKLQHVTLANATINKDISTRLDTINTLFVKKDEVDNNLLLKRESPAIDKGVIFESRPFKGVAPDLGFHEFAGDTIFVSKASGKPGNSGRTKDEPLPTIKSAIEKASQHDYIIVATGKYSDEKFRSDKPVSIAATSSNGAVSISGEMLFTNHIRIDSCGFNGETTRLILRSNSSLLQHCWFSKCKKALSVTGKGATEIINNTFSQCENSIETENQSEIKIRNSIFTECGKVFSTKEISNISVSHTDVWPKQSIQTISSKTLFHFNPLLAHPDTVNLHPLPHSPCSFSGENRGYIGAFAPLRESIQRIKNNTPSIVVHGINRQHMRTNAKVSFVYKNTSKEDYCYATIDSNIFVNGTEIYEEGRYCFKAFIRRDGDIICDTTIYLTIDFTPPEIIVPSIPPFSIDDWKEGHDNIWEKRGSGVSSQVIVKDHNLLKKDIRINGQKSKSSNLTINNEGLYTVNVTAEDSAGNISRELITFRLLGKTKDFSLRVLTPELIDSTSETIAKLSGYINSPHAKLLINGNPASVKVFAESTYFDTTVKLQTGINKFEIKALSTVSGNYDSKTVRIVQDTSKPRI